MKKLTIVLSLFVLTGTAVRAQDLKKAKAAYTMASLKPETIENAKAEVDKLMNDDKTSKQAESHLLKMQVYSTIAADEVLAAKHPNADNEAMEALKKYLELEPSEVKLKADNYNGVNTLYSAYFKTGAKLMQSEEWGKSFEKFEKLVEVSDTLISRKWTTSLLDTTAILYAGVAAQNSKNDAKAVKYYQRLAEHKIAGKQNEIIYDFLTRYYLNNPDKQQFNKYIAIAKETYPDQKLWEQLELAYLEDNSTLEEKLKLYSENLTSGKTSPLTYASFGSFFANIKSDDVKGDSAQEMIIKRKGIEAFEKAFNLDNSNGLYAFNVGVLHNNEWNVLMDRYRAHAGTAPALKAKREAIDKIAEVEATNAIEWLEKAYEILSAKTEKDRNERSALSNNVKLLANLYEYKREKSKGKPAEYDKYQKKFDTYDQLVGKPF